jgi:hypothetical protein
MRTSFGVRGPPVKGARKRRRRRRTTRRRRRMPPPALTHRFAGSLAHWKNSLVRPASLLHLRLIAYLLGPVLLLDSHLQQ